MFVLLIKSGLFFFLRFKIFIIFKIFFFLLMIGFKVFFWVKAFKFLVYFFRGVFLGVFLLLLMLLGILWLFKFNKVGLEYK